MPPLHSAGKIHQLELENFKSYKGQQTIGPVTSFTAVIGPNGSGKSNLMDAISFILGVHTAHLCGYQLKDLIYAADDLDRDQRGRKAFVRLIYRFTDGSEIQFTGGITSAGGSEYRVEGQVVNWEEYSSKLKSLGPFKARNFLVFQKSIEDKLKKLKQEKESIKEVILRITPELHKLRNVIAERTSKISSLEKRINEIVDQTCKKFSESVGVKNIREYEENQLKAAQEMPEEMLNVRNQQSKLKYQLEYEQKQDMDSQFTKLGSSLSALRSSLEELDAKEHELKSAIERVSDDLDHLKGEMKGILKLGAI